MISWNLLRFFMLNIREKHKRNEGAKQKNKYIFFLFLNNWFGECTSLEQQVDIPRPASMNSLNSIVSQFHIFFASPPSPLPRPALSDSSILLHPLSCEDNIPFFMNQLPPIDEHAAKLFNRMPIGYWIDSNSGRLSMSTTPPTAWNHQWVVHSKMGTGECGQAAQIVVRYCEI